MAFLQLWWDETATAAQQVAFTSLVQDGRIEFVDNGWSQHDMGCTTLDSMISNWVEGHQWLLEKFGPEAQPKTGWSLDPFGTIRVVLSLALVLSRSRSLSRVVLSRARSLSRALSLDYVYAYVYLLFYNFNCSYI